MRYVDRIRVCSPALACVLALLLVCTGPAVFATYAAAAMSALPPGASERIANPDSSLGDSSEESAEGTACAATWDELAAWIKTHRTAGGTVKLTANIACPGIMQWVRPRNARPVVLDLGEFSLSIGGVMEMYAYDLTIRGHGGEDASLRVEAGGYLDVSGAALVAGPGGPVVWQREGGALLTDVAEEDKGAVRYLADPIVHALGDNPYLVPVKPGEDPAGLLPQTVRADLCLRGESRKNVEVPVDWILSTQEVEEAIAERQRVDLTGTLVGMDSIESPVCTLTFLEQPITLMWLEAVDYNEYKALYGTYTVPDLPITVQPQYSFDGKTWFDAEEEVIEAEYQASFYVNFYMPEHAEELGLVWDTEQHPKLYFRLYWLEAEREADAYSDSIMVDGKTLQLAFDVGGNRGGGSDLTEPPLTIVPPPMPEQPKPEPEPAAPPAEDTQTPDLPDEAEYEAERIPLAAREWPEPVKQDAQAPTVSQPLQAGENSPDTRGGETAAADSGTMAAVPAIPAKPDIVSVYTEPDKRAQSEESAEPATAAGMNAGAAGPTMGSMAAGFSATAAVLGAAALYVSPGLRAGVRRTWEARRGRGRRK